MKPFFVCAQGGKALLFQPRICLWGDLELTIELGLSIVALIMATPVYDTFSISHLALSMHLSM